MADSKNVRCHQCKKDMFVQCIASCGEEYPPCVVVENCHNLQHLQAKIADLNIELELFIAGDPRFTWVYFSNKLQQLLL